MLCRTDQAPPTALTLEMRQYLTLQPLSHLPTLCARARRVAAVAGDPQVGIAVQGERAGRGGPCAVHDQARLKSLAPQGPPTAALETPCFLLAVRCHAAAGPFVGV